MAYSLARSRVAFVERHSARRVVPRSKSRGARQAAGSAEVLISSVSNGESFHLRGLLTERFFDFLIGFVLAQCVYRPNRCRDPADERQLQDQTESAGKGTAYREEG